MKRNYFWFFTIIMVILLSLGIASAGVFLPQGLTVIEAESFMGDSSLTGLLVLPEQIKQIGDDAFSQTNLFALQIPANTDNVEKQMLNHAAYVKALGKETVFSSISGVKYMIGPSDSSARSFARSNLIPFVTEEQLVEHDGFYYQRSDNGLKLLSAIDGTQLGGEIIIPNRIGKAQVTSLSAFAFYGCNGLKTIHIPETLKNDKNIEAALEDCSKAEVIFDHVGLIVRSVRPNAGSGSVGDSITWTVDVSSDAPVQTYLYTLEKEGETIDTLQSNDSTYSKVIEIPGAYSLSVEVTDSNGNRGNGSSSKLYIAVESMAMNVPETLLNGEDLEVQIEEVENAISYSIYLTNDTTGKLIDYRQLDEAGKATFGGYLLEEGTWRVTGYVYGNDFHYSVPTVKKVEVYGTKAQGPIIPAQDPISYYQESRKLQISETDPFAIKYQFRYSDGTLSKAYDYLCPTGEYFYIYPEGGYKQWEKGGAILLRGALKQNGLWTGWGETIEVEVLPVPKLDTPVLTAPETAQAGKDLTVTFTSVEHGYYYNLSVVEGYNPDRSESNYNSEEKEVFFEQYQRGRTVIIPGYYLSAGVYTLRLYVWSEEGYYQSNVVDQKLTITGERPAAPVITADKTEQCVYNDPLTLSICSPGAEGAYIFCENWRNGRKYTWWGPNSVSLNEEGNGTRKENWSFSDEEGYIGTVFHYRATAIIDGIWSEFSDDVTVLMTASDPFPSPTISMPEELRAGEDFSFSFNSVTGADYYSASLSRVYGDGTIYSWYDEECIPDQKLTVPGYLLNQGSYRLEVRVYSKSRQVSRAEEVFNVSGIRPTAPTIINYPKEVHVKDNVKFTIDTEETDRLVINYKGTFSNGYGGGYSGKEIIVSTGAATSWSYRFDEDSRDMTFTFGFAVQKDGIWSRWQNIILEVQDLPPLDLAVIHTDDTIEAGKDFIVTIDPVEHASYYEYSLYKDNKQIKYRSSIPSSRQIIFYGYDLDPGEYILKVYAYSDDYTTSESVRNFSVVGNKPNAPEAFVNKTDVLSEERYKFTIGTAGADALVARQETYYTNYSYKDYRSIDVQGDLTVWETSYYSASTVDYCFAVLIDGKWSAWSIANTVTIRQKPTLAETVIDVAQTTTAGKDLSFQFSPVEDATSYSASFASVYGGDTLYRFDSDTALPDTELTIPGYLINSGMYVISVTAAANDYSSTTSSIYVKATGKRPTYPEVTVEEPLRVKSTVTFAINTEEAEELQVKYQYKAEYNWWPEQRENIPVTGSLTNWSLSIDQYKQEANLTISFATKKDGVWSSWRTRIFTIAGQPPLNPAMIHVDDLIEAGRDFTITVDAVENATHYEYRFYRPDGSSNWNNKYEPIGEITYNASNMDPGEYRFKVWAYSDDYATSESEKAFTIAGDRPDAPNVSVDNPDVKVYERFKFTIDTENVEALVYRVGTGSAYNINVLEDTTEWTAYQYNAGNYEYRFAVKRNGVWSAWSDPKEIRVTNYDPIDAPDITILSTLESGRNFEVKISEVEDATSYYIRFEKTDGTLSFSRTLYPENGDTVTFPGYRITAGTYTVKAYAQNSHVNSTTTQKTIAIVNSERPGAPDVTPPSETTVSSYTYVNFTIDTTGMEKVAVRYYNSGNTDDVNYIEKVVENDSTATDWRFYYYGSSTKYSFAVMKEGLWSEWSSFITINPAQ